MKLKLIENYSEKGCALVGQTYDLRNDLKELNGSFNPRLKYEGLTVAGWVFSKKKLDAIRLLVAKHSVEALTVLPIEREQNAKVEPVHVEPVKKTIEPVKQIKQAAKVQTGFKMLVKCSGFVELEREFTSEQVMTKFLNDLRKQREKEVDSKMGVLRKGSTRLYFNAWNSRPDQVEDAINKLKKEFKDNGVLPLKIEFTNLLIR